MAKRLIYAAAGAFCGYFLGIRIIGAFLQIFSVSLPVFAAWAFFAAGGAAGFLFYKKAHEHLKLHAFGDKPWAAVLALLMWGLCFKGRYALLDFQTDMSISGLSALAASLGAGILLASFILHFIHAFSYTFIRKYRITRYDIITAISILVVMNILVVLFCKNNRMICYWDNAGFWISARNLADMLKESGPVEVLRTAYSSVFTEDYNYIIALPAALLAYVFGESRMVYILGVTNLYLYPIYLFVYAVSRRICRRPAVASVLTIGAFPFMFFVSIQGYIDAGAVLAACIALWLWYSNRDDTSPERAIIIGLVLAMAMILRRWLVFFAIAYIVAYAIDSFIYRRRISPLVWLLLSLAFGLLFLFQPYVTVRLMANYSGMYSAYDLGLKTDLFTFIHYMGVIPMLAALIPLAIMLISRKGRRTGVFMLLLLGVCFLVFVKIQSHGEQHLMLYMPAFFCLVCEGFAYVINNKKPIALCALAAAVSAAPVVCAVTADNSKVGTDIITLEPCISCMPQKRGDVDQILALTGWLDENVGDKGKKAAVIASSLTFNREVLFNAEASLNLSRSSSSDRDEYLPWLPQVDGRDDIPHEILNADYVIVADPIQTHLSPENQTVVTIPAETFLKGEDIANAYVKRDEVFRVGWDGSISVYIYEKTRDITEAEEQEFLNKFAHLGILDK